ncbi:hypothetical protein AX17_005228 [Amanita inopinata Kibby_2008]|nr:hypothetical protein AX17_005228 [Amanita inopinata Kibby_2008]
MATFTDDESDSQVFSTTPTHRTLGHATSSEPSQSNSSVTSHLTVPSSPNMSRQGPPPILIRSPSSNSRRGLRSRSISSSQVHRGHREDSVLSGEDESVDDEDDTGRVHLRRRGKAAAVGEEDGDDDEVESEESDEDEDHNEGDDDPITLRDRQSLINVQHPFGLPIWKPALYKKSRSVTRYADAALHSVPSAQAERHLLPGNIFWAVAFGWWMSLICFAVSLILRVVPLGGKRYSSLVFGLGWYLAWPFGKYVEGDVDEGPKVEDEEGGSQNRRWSGTSDGTIRATSPGQPGSAEPSNHRVTDGSPNDIFTAQPTQPIPNVGVGETATLLRHENARTLKPSKSYGATSPPLSPGGSSRPTNAVKCSSANDILGRICFWLALICVIAPIMLTVCLLCWALVVTIPMARLNWALIMYLFQKPTEIRFCAAPPAVVVSTNHAEPTATGSTEAGGGSSRSPPPQISFKHPRLSEGQVAPSGHPTSTVLLCTYRAVGLQYYKYTVGGVNIIFVNLLPVVFFVIFDGMVLLRMAEKLEHRGKHIPFLLSILVSKGLIFLLCLLSVIPLSYFIGMAVASISAQSSIGMGAVINATFGSIIEIILYGIALTQGKGHLVEGSIVGSLLAGVLLMPGMSMCSMALRRKEQTFNAKSAGVTSMMLIMAIIGALAPTLFYQTYGNFQLVCTGCPSGKKEPKNAPWICEHCYYKHPDPVDDPFYQSTVKDLMYFCAAILLFSYLIGLWFSLRTHASQIWQNPQQLLHTYELPTHGRTSLHQKLIPSSAQQQPRSGSLNRKTCAAANLGCNDLSRSQTPASRDGGHTQQGTSTRNNPSLSPTFPRRVSYAPNAAIPSSPTMESVDHLVRNAGIQLNSTLTTEELERVVAAVTASALRHQEAQGNLPARARSTSVVTDAGEHGGGHGHDAPSWSRTTSASVLLGCTALFAIIAELLVDVVDVVLEGSGIDEKFLGVTLFALVPNTTEFMNAMSFALNGNIALSMEIGSAYALQVCLLQIPAMVAFSAWYDPEHMGEVARTFTLIFPRWDVVALILSMFLMTYTYIEARSNYHRGSILILSYLVLIAGFYFAPPSAIDIDQGHDNDDSLLPGAHAFSLTFWQAIKWYLTSWW